MASESKFPLKVVLSAVDRVTGPLKKVSRNLRTTFGALGGKLKKVGLGIAAAGAVAAFAIVKLVKSVANAGDEVAKFSARFGIGIGALQEYRFAADRVGTSQTVFNNSLGAFTKRLGEAKIGTGALVSFLNKADPALLKVLKSTKSTEEGLDVMFDALARIEDPTKRAALAASAFSRAGIAMVNFVTDGSDALKNMRQRARDLGLVMSDEAAKGSEKFVDATTDVSAVLLGLKIIVGSKLIPILTELALKFVDFAVESQDKVEAFGRSLANSLPKAIETVRESWTKFLDRVKPVADFFSSLVEKFGVVDTALGVLSLTLTAFLAPAFFAAAAAALQFSIAVTANPIGLAVFLVLLMVSAIALMILKMRLAGVTFNEMWLGIKLAVFSAVDAIRSKLKGLADALPDWLIKAIRFGIPIGRIAFADPDQKGSLAAPVSRELLNSVASRTIAEQESNRLKSELTVNFKNAPEGTTIEDVGAQAIDLITQSGFGAAL